jgi:hypothetical protein
MVIFSLTAVLTSEYAKLVASFIAGSAAVRLWFAKEIAKGKAELKKIETAVVNEIKKL